jgi:hypothetical protein
MSNFYLRFLENNANDEQLRPGVSGGIGGGRLAIWRPWAAGAEKVAIYSFTSIGVGIGIGLKKTLAEDDSTFDSDVMDPKSFWGTVKVGGVHLTALAVGFGWQSLIWISGPAQGTVCEGFGSDASIGLELAESFTTLILKFNESVDRGDLDTM